MAGDLTLEERIRRNYNRLGVAVMQALYSDDYLSVGGTDSTDVLAELAGVGSHSEVLDLGCGVGGPALHLAGSTGCHVTGIDLVETSIEICRERARERGLRGRTRFEAGDATSLELGDAGFDVVWGQDAWCHVPDKAALLSEAARVLRPGGTIAFTDWLAGDGMTAEDRQRALDAALSPHAATHEQYVSMLADAGFGEVHHDDIGAELDRRYQQICATLRTNAGRLTDRFGARVFEIVSETNEAVRHGFAEGGIGGGRYVAVKGP